MRLLNKDKDYSTLDGGDLVAQIWHDETTQAGLDALIEAVAEKQRAGKRIYLLVVSESAKPPSKELRLGIAAFMSKYGNTIRAAAMIHEGSGFGAAAVRAIVSSLSLVARHPFPYKVFGNMKTALDWYEEVSGPKMALPEERQIRRFLRV